MHCCACCALHMVVGQRDRAGGIAGHLWWRKRCFAVGPRRVGEAAAATTSECGLVAPMPPCLLLMHPPAATASRPSTQQAAWRGAEDRSHHGEVCRAVLRRQPLCLPHRSVHAAVGLLGCRSACVPWCRRAAACSCGARMLCRECWECCGGARMRAAHVAAACAAAVLAFCVANAACAAAVQCSCQPDVGLIVERCFVGAHALHQPHMNEPCLPGCLPAADGAYLLAFAIIMLNTDAHNPMADRWVGFRCRSCCRQQGNQSACTAVASSCSAHRSPQAHAADGGRACCPAVYAAAASALIVCGRCHSARPSFLPHLAA